MQKCAMKESTWKDFLLYHGRRFFFLEWNYSVGILKLFIILFIYHFHCLSLSLSGAVVCRCEKRSQQEIWTFAVIVQYTKIVWKPTHLTVSKMLCLIFFFFSLLPTPTVWEEGKMHSFMFISINIMQMPVL